MRATRSTQGASYVQHGARREHHTCNTDHARIIMCTTRSTQGASYVQHGARKDHDMYNTELAGIIMRATRSSHGSSCVQHAARSEHHECNTQHGRSITHRASRMTTNIRSSLVNIISTAIGSCSDRVSLVCNNLSFYKQLKTINSNVLAIRISLNYIKIIVAVQIQIMHLQLNITKS